MYTHELAHAYVRWLCYLLMCVVRSLTNREKTGVYTPTAPTVSTLPSALDCFL